MAKARQWVYSGRYGLRSEGWRQARRHHKGLEAFSLTFLARSAKLPTGLYILPSVISLLFIFLMIPPRTIISGSAGPIFVIFSPNGSVLGADDRPGPLFKYDVQMCRFWRILTATKSLVRASSRRSVSLQVSNKPHNSRGTLVF